MAQNPKPEEKKEETPTPPTGDQSQSGEDQQPIPPVEPGDLPAQGLMTAEQVQEMMTAMQLQFTTQIDELKTELTQAQETAHKATSEEVKRLTATQEAAITTSEIKKIDSAELTQEFESDRERMKKHLASQPKVRTFVIAQPNEKPGIAKEFVSINGYELWIPKGVFVEVPQQVHEILQDYQHIPETVSQEFRLDLNTGKAARL